MATTVFYAWQSDTPASVNRLLIRKAVEEAIERMQTQRLRMLPVWTKTRRMFPARQRSQRRSWRRFAPVPRSWLT
jgi:hypothetical protein